jgi:hypothetical protein
MPTTAQETATAPTTEETEELDCSYKGDIDPAKDQAIKDIVARYGGSVAWEDHGSDWVDLVRDLNVEFKQAVDRDVVAAELTAIGCEVKWYNENPLFDLYLHCAYAGKFDPKKDEAVLSIINRYKGCSEGTTAFGRFLGGARERFFVATINDYKLDQKKLEAELRTAGCDLVEWYGWGYNRPPSFKRFVRAIGKMVATKSDGRALGEHEFVSNELLIEFDEDAPDLHKLVDAANRIVEEEFAEHGRVRTMYVLSRLGKDQPDIVPVPDGTGSDTVLRAAIEKDEIVGYVFVYQPEDAPIITFLARDVRGLVFGGTRKIEVSSERKWAPASLGPMHEVMDVSILPKSDPWAEARQRQVKH